MRSLTNRQSISVGIYCGEFGAILGNWIGAETKLKVVNTHAEIVILKQATSESCIYVVSSTTGIKLKSLILAQIERWRNALHMQVERQHGACSGGEWRTGE